MKDQWDDPSFATEWDETTDVGSPTRAEQLDLIASLVARLYRPGAAILDLGAGSGQLEELLLRRVPDAHVAAVDASAAMQDIARRRLAAWLDRIALVEGDFAEIDSIVLPWTSFQIVLSVQALHHVSHEVKRKVFAHVHRLTEPGGVFLVMDRVAIPEEELRPIYREMWERLERTAKAKSGWSGDFFLDRVKTKEDFPETVEAHLALLREAGFDAACVHLHLDRAVLVGVRS